MRVNLSSNLPFQDQLRNFLLNPFSISAKRFCNLFDINDFVRCNILNDGFSLDTRAQTMDFASQNRIKLQSLLNSLHTLSKLHIPSIQVVFNDILQSGDRLNQRLKLRARNHLIPQFLARHRAQGRQSSIKSQVLNRTKLAYFVLLIYWNLDQFLDCFFEVSHD